MTDEKVEPLPPTPEEWHALPLEKRREIVESGSRSFMEAYEKENPGWLEAAGLRILWGALKNLQDLLSSEKDPEITWESPILELQFALPWDWSVGAPAIIEMPDEFLQDTQSPSKWFAGVFLESMDLEAMKALTSGAAVRVRGGETETLIAPDIQARVDEMTPEEQDAFFADFGKPFVLGAEFLSDDEVEEWDEEDEDGEPVTLVSPTEAARKRLEDLKPILTFHGDAHGTPFSGSIIFAVHPLVVDEDKREAFYPVTVGLQFDPLEDHHADLVARVPTFPDPGTWPAEDRTTFWKGLLSDIRAWEEKLSRGEPVEPTPEGAAIPATGEEGAASGSSATATTSETATTSTMEVFRALDATAVRVVAPSEERTRFLTDSPSRVSKETSLFLGRSPRLTLPRKWAAIPKWDDLVALEVEKILGREGEAAFESRPGSPARLERRYNAKTKEEEVRLTKAGTADLEDTYGPGCFRRVELDADKRRREYLVRILPVEGGGRMEFRTSWYGTAWPLMGDGPDREKTRLEEMRGGAQGELFEDLPPHVQDEVENRLRNLEHIRDAKSLMEHVALKFGGEGRNPVHVTAAELRMVLGCETSPDGLARVRGALRALAEVSFTLELTGTADPFRLSGRFLSSSLYHPKGPGDHADGDFYLGISPPFIGGLRIFEVRGRKLRDVREVTVFDWRANPPKEERKALAGYSRRQTRLAVPLFTAKNFTEPQKALFRFLQENLTRKNAPIQRHRKGRRDLVSRGRAKDAHHHRPYGHDFCPLIPKGTLYAGALGEFLPAPESGWTLAGTATARTGTGGGHVGGLLSVMGHPYPPGRAVAARRESTRKALEDLRFVVEEVLGGLVVARLGDRWLSLEGLKKLQLHEGVLSRKVKFFPFLPLDLQAKVKEILDPYNAERHARGETPYLWKVRSAGEPEPEPLVPEVLEAETEPPEAAPVGLQGGDLWTALRAARTERKLSQAKVGALFGVIQQALAAWERGPEAGKPIPPELAPLVRRWVENGTAPTEEELASRRTRRTGGRKPSA